MPPLRDSGRTLSCVGYTDGETLLAPSAAHSLPADCTRKIRWSCASRFLRGRASPYYQRVAEQHPSARLQYAKHLAQHFRPSGRWHITSFEKTASKLLSLKGRFVEASHSSKRARALSPFATASCRIANPGCINVQSDKAAAHVRHKV